MRRLEEVSLQPVRPPASQPPLEVNDPIGLPSYEEAIAKSGQHDAPPPPYPGYVRTRVLVVTFTCTALTSYAHSWTFGSHWNLVLVPVTVHQRKLNQKTRMFAINKEETSSWGAPSLGKFRWGIFWVGYAQHRRELQLSSYTQVEAIIFRVSPKCRHEYECVASVPWRRITSFPLFSSRTGSVRR